MGHSASSAAPRPWDVSEGAWASSPRAQARQGSRSHSSGSGRSLHGDYEVHSKVLGRGSNRNAVLLVTSRAGGRACAVKTLHAASSPEARRRAESEVRIMLSLDHPHVVRLWDVYFEPDGKVHLVMEHLSGGELFFRVARQGALSEREAAAATAQVLRAVGYLHANGVAHRDLKPENFLYESKDPEAALRLIDFGFAKLLEPNKLMHRSCGSLMYVSPEVLSHEGYTHKCDMWSVGVITYLLLMGHPPFRGNDRDLRRMIKAGSVDLMQRAMGKWNSLSQEATDFVKCLLVKDPERRPSAQEMALHPWLIRSGATRCAVLPLSERMVRSLEAYVSAPPMERAVLQVVAKELPGGAAPQLREVFLSLDLANQGTLNVRDVQEALLKACRQDGASLAEEDADRLMSALAAIWGGRVTYSSFLAAVLEPRAALDPDATQAAFRRLDADLSGSLGVEDLQRSLGDRLLAEADVAEWVHHHSADGSEGEVDAKAFVQMLSTRTDASAASELADEDDSPRTASRTRQALFAALEPYANPRAVSKIELEGVGPQSQDWDADIFLF